MAGKNESIKVFVRVRPPILDEICESAAVHVSNRTSINLYSEKHNLSCGFDCVFNETASQAEIFQEVKPLLKNVLHGENMCIFAYGQTNSGKSYTMIGPEGGQKKDKEAATFGLIPRISQYLITSLRKKLDAQRICYFQVKVSFLQIYNEILIDLLRDNNTAVHGDEDEKALKIREIPRSRNNPGGEVYVAGLSEFRVQTVEDIMKIIKIGNSNRITNNSYYNNNSSRSHAILQLFFEIERYADDDNGLDDNDDEEGGDENGPLRGEDRDGENTIIYRSKLNLVDLAGSEKIDTNYTGGGGIISGNEVSGKQHIRELTSINKSLMCLSNIITILANKSKPSTAKSFGKDNNFVPYRDSKLTRLLQDSLGGSNGRTLIIACLTPLQQNVSESINTLTFADKAKNVMLKIKVNSLLVNGGSGGGASAGGGSEALIKADSEIKRLRTLLQHYMKAAEGGAEGGDDSGGQGYFSQLVEENNRLKVENENLRKEVKKALIKINSNNNSNNYNSYEDSNPMGRNNNRGRANVEVDNEEPTTEPVNRRDLHKNPAMNPASNDFGGQFEPEDQHSSESFEYSPSHNKKLAKKKAAQIKAGAGGSSKSSINAYIAGNSKFEKAEGNERAQAQREAMINMRYVSPIYSQSGPPSSNNINYNNNNNSINNNNINGNIYNTAGSTFGGMNNSNSSLGGVGISDVRASNGSLGGQLTGGFAGMSSNQIETHIAQLNPSSNRLESLIHRGLTSLLVKQGGQAQMQGASAVANQVALNQWPPGHNSSNSSNTNNIINNMNNSSSSKSNSNNNNAAVVDDPHVSLIEDMRRKIKEAEAKDNINQNIQFKSELKEASSSINKTLSKEKEDLMKIQRKREKLEKELSNQLKNITNHDQDQDNVLGKSVESNASMNRYESDSFEDEDESLNRNNALGFKVPSQPQALGSQAQTSSQTSNRTASMRQSIASASEQQFISSPVKKDPLSIHSSASSDNKSFPLGGNINIGAGSMKLNGGGDSESSSLKSKYSVSNDAIANVMQAAGLNKVKVPLANANPTSNSNSNTSCDNNINSSNGSNDNKNGSIVDNNNNSNGGGVTSQHKENNSPANLSYSSEDVNRVIQLYSFRMNKWEYITIEDYNSSNNFHKCKFIGDSTESAAASKGTSQWMDLKKKPIRGC